MESDYTNNDYYYTINAIESIIDIGVTLKDFEIVNSYLTKLIQIMNKINPINKVFDAIDKILNIF